MIRLEDRPTVQGMALGIYCARIQAGGLSKGMLIIPDASEVAGEAVALLNAIDRHLPHEDKPLGRRRRADLPGVPASEEKGP